MIINHVEKALQYATVLKGDVMLVSDYVEEGNPNPKAVLADEEAHEIPT
jgi:hypothetical protein